MATLILKGDMATINLDGRDEDGDVIARCIKHHDHPLCRWTATYDDLNDAAEYAADHADTGRQ